MTNTLETRRELLIGAATAMANERLALNITRETMAEILGTKLDWELEDEDVLYDPNSSDMDTIVREDVMDCIAKFYMGRTWPCGFENVSFASFYEKLKTAIQEKNK